MNLTELFTNIANSLRAKTGKEDKIVAETFPNEIDSIKSMAETNDATATAEDITEGKTAYVKEEKIVGTMKASEYNIKLESPTGTNAKIITNITEIDLSKYDISNTTSFSGMFENFSSIKELNLSNLIANKVTSMANMFSSCIALIKITGELDANKVTSISGVFGSGSSTSTTKLTTFDGFKDLGKAYTQKTANYNSYRLYLQYCNALTHDSLMKIINNLYDLNLTYDVANGGTLYAQTLQLGATNRAKLTEEEIGIATAKGWNVT